MAQCLYAPDRDRLATILQAQSEFDALFKKCRKQNIWPAPWLASPQMHPIPAFANLDLPQLETLADVADWLFLEAEDLAGYTDATGWREDHGETGVNHYFYHLSAKASGDLRLIEAPKPRLKSFQRQILRSILASVPPHPDSFAFIAGRDCRQAAARHVGEEAVVSFDLKDFFNTIPSARVYGLFRCLGYPSGVAQSLTRLCTVKTPKRILAQMPSSQRQVLRIPHLPQGAPTSPALANLLCFNLDRRLSGLARKLGAAYSRYADDLSFSGDRRMCRNLCKYVPQIVADEGFVLNEAKTRIMRSTGRQTVTGLVVNSHLNVPRQDFDRLKAVIHRGAWRHDRGIHAQLLGQIGWVSQIHPAKGEKLRQLME